jgi:psiF repeat
MRLAFAASALCLSALSLGILALAAQPVTPQSTAPASSATSPAAPAATTPASASVAGDAAARHVKRTACLKEAKEKKLIGADKTAFLKTCIEAPKEPISASRHILPDRP